MTRLSPRFPVFFVSIVFDVSGLAQAPILKLVVPDEVVEARLRRGQGFSVYWGHVSHEKTLVIPGLLVNTGIYRDLYIT